jgi:hypothetical protein
MDSVEILWLIGLAAWALVSRFSRSRKKVRPPAASPPAEAGAPTVPQSLRELLGEIRRGLVEQFEPPPAPEPVRRLRVEVEAIEPEPVYEPLPPAPVPWASKPRRRRSPMVQGLLDDLGSGPESLARAMLMVEVLGPPVALRDGSAGRRIG